MKDQLYLKPQEGNFLSMAVVTVLENLQNANSNEKLNWTPEARKQLKDMLAAGESLKLKLQKLGFDMQPLPDYNEGDESEFLTKQS